MTAASAAAVAATGASRDDVIAAFGARGALARSVDGFVARPSQAAMAAAVHDAIVSGATLIAEAGTGTGKTFAYLVAALLAGGKVLVSTGTKPLQDQLCKKDLPTVLRALKLNASVALLKGRANYVCLQRLSRAESDGRLPSRDDVFHLRSIVRFAKSTRSGDRGELGGVPETATIWPLVTSTRDNCLGSECARFGDCFVYKARREAQAADIVVVNHHLFLADLALRDDAIRDFLPEVDTVILDEAHQLPAIAADFFGSSLTLSQVLELARDARALGLAHAADGASWPTLTSGLERAAKDLRLALTDIGLAPGSRTPLARIARRSTLAETIDVLDRASAALARALTINRGRSPELDLVGARVDGLRRALGEWQRACSDDNAQLDGGEGAEGGEGGEGEGRELPAVRWISVSAHGAQFNKTPLAPGAALARARAAQPQAWILTSATLTADKRFDHFVAALGIEDTVTARWDSPFDFARQALLYVPAQLPSPLDRDFSERVAELAWPLLRANGGRAFVLCTTLRAVDRVAQRLRQLAADDGAQLPLLVQGEASRPALLDTFRRAGNAILVGSISFWEGIDIRGDALSLVVIDKLPFAPPDDPVVEAKIRYLKQCGRNAFAEFQLPEAIVLLKQGAGRLIRDENDRGVLMMLDERLLTKSYGKTVLASLPDFSRTRSAEAAIRFLAPGSDTISDAASESGCSDS